jgi:hypothetical protein
MNALTIEEARDDVSASSAGGAPFLIAFGVSLAICGVLGMMLPAKTAALITLFQGNLALPLAFLLERRLRARPSQTDVFKSLSIQMAMTQIVALPAVLLVYALQPAYVPAAFAAIGGGHFLPYAWLHRTRLYIALGVGVSVGAFALAIALGLESFSPVLFYVSGCYLAAAPALLSHARRLTTPVGAIA